MWQDKRYGDSLGRVVGITEGEGINRGMVLRSNVVFNTLILKGGIKGVREISLYSLDGKRVKVLLRGGFNGEGELRFSLKDIPAGVYFLRISGKDRDKIEKVIKIRR